MTRHPHTIRYVTDPETGRRWPIVAGGSGEGEGSGESSSGEGSTGEGSGEGGSGEGSGNTGNTGTGETSGTGKVEFTAEQQTAIDQIIAKRVKDASEKARKDAADEAKQAADRAKMDETDRLKAEKADAETKAQQAAERANSRLITSEAKVTAVTAGGDPKQAAYIVRLADLDDIDVDEDGNPDSEAITKAITQVLTDVPALKAQPGKGGPSGGDLGGGDGPKRAGSIGDAVEKHYATQG